MKRYTKEELDPIIKTHECFKSPLTTLRSSHIVEDGKVVATVWECLECGTIWEEEYVEG